MALLVSNFVAPVASTDQFQHLNLKLRFGIQRLIAVVPKIRVDFLARRWNAAFRSRAMVQISAHKLPHAVEVWIKTESYGKG